jgi:hypothetical protein
MARPITNYSNWWREEDEKDLIELLTGCAILVLNQYNEAKDHTIEAEDLISEGWLRVLRYGNFDRASRKATAWRLCREMKRSYWRMKKWGRWPSAPKRFHSKNEPIIREGGESVIPDDWL